MRKSFYVFGIFVLLAGLVLFVGFLFFHNYLKHPLTTEDLFFTLLPFFLIMLGFYLMNTNKPKEED